MITAFETVFEIAHFFGVPRVQFPFLNVDRNQPVAEGHTGVAIPVRIVKVVIGKRGKKFRQRLVSVRIIVSALGSALRVDPGTRFSKFCKPVNLFLNCFLRAEGAAVRAQIRKQAFHQIVLLDV